MHKILLFFILWFVLFSPSHTYAQSWAWGKAGIGAGNDAWAVATDASGNVFGAGINYEGTATVFGTYTVAPGGADYQTVWVKYNNAGTALWAGGTVSGATYLYNIATDPSGDLIVFGSFSGATMKIGSFTLTNAETGSQYFIAKISPAGVVLWAINDGTTYGDYLGILSMYVMSTGGVATDAAGNIYITSSFDGTMTIGGHTLTSAGEYDIFVAKYNPAGVVQWEQSMGGADEDYGFGITAAATGNVYITGAFYSPTVTVGATTIHDTYGTGAGGKPATYIAEFSAATGAPVWAQAAGGAHGAFGVGIASDAVGNVYMTGGFADPTIAFGATTITQTYPVVGKLALYLVQYSPAGVATWSQTIGSATEPLWGYCIALASCGQVWVSGNYTQAAKIDTSTLVLAVGSDPVFIAGYNLSGGVVGYAGLASGGDDQNGIAADANGNIFICSDYQDRVILGADTLNYGTAGEEYFYVGKYTNVVALPDTNYAHRDTAVGCGTGFPLILTADSGYSTYFWDDSSVLQTRSVDSAGTYWVYNIACGVPVLIDTFYVSVVAADTTHSHQDTSACALNDTTTLIAPSGYTGYTWSTGATGSTIVVTTAGIYIAFCTTGCSLLVDTFHFSITQPDTTYKTTDTSSCVGLDMVTLTAPPGYTTYRWSTGSTSSTIVVSVTGAYILYAISGCNVLIDTFNYTIVPNDTTFMATDTGVCVIVGAVTLYGPPGYTSYIWSTGSTASSIIVTVAGSYINYATLGCKTLVDTFNVIFNPMPVVALGNDTGFCSGDSIILSSAQPSGSTFLWSTGSTSATITVYTTGVYWLQVTNTFGCSTTDTITITVTPIPIVNLGPADTTVCVGDSITLKSLNTYPAGVTYLWNTGATTSSIVAYSSGTYWLQVTDSKCFGSDTIHVLFVYDTLLLYNRDTAICRGQSVDVFATGSPAIYYQWTPTAGIAVSNVIDPIITPDTSATYIITGVYPSCPNIVDSFHINVEPVPTVYLGGNRSVCQYDTIHITASVSPQWYTGYIYSWSPSTYLDNTTASTVVFTAGDTAEITLTVSTPAPAGCSGGDSVQIIVHTDNFVHLDTTVTVCPGDSVQLLPDATGMVASYSWSPGLYISNTAAAAPWIFPITTQSYYAIATSQYGCLDTLTANITVMPAAVLYLGDSVTLYPGQTYQVDPQTNCTSFAWFPPAGLSDAYIANPLANPIISTKYVVYGTTEWGCKTMDSIEIYVDPNTLLAIPNAFTPGNGPNNLFKIIVNGEATLNYFRIFNRWGNLVYSSTNINDGWDGTYNGTPQPFDVYVYEIEAVTNTGTVFHKHGNVTLVR